MGEGGELYSPAVVIAWVADTASCGWDGAGWAPAPRLYRFDHYFLNWVKLYGMMFLVVVSSLLCAFLN
jgi:hypothetical protein